MPFCSKCGIEVMSESLFCHACGANIIVADEHLNLDKTQLISTVVHTSQIYSTVTPVRKKLRFTVSIFSLGYRFFRPEIFIEPEGLTIKIQYIFSRKTEFFDFNSISNISVNTPLIGFSTITFHAASAKVSVQGFTKRDVRQIKKAIEDGKKTKFH